MRKIINFSLENKILGSTSNQLKYLTLNTICYEFEKLSLMQEDIMNKVFS